MSKYIWPGNMDGYIDDYVYDIQIDPYAAICC